MYSRPRRTPNSVLGQRRRTEILTYYTIRLMGEMECRTVLIPLRQITRSKVTDSKWPENIDPFIYENVLVNLKIISIGLETIVINVFIVQELIQSLSTKITTPDAKNEGIPLIRSFISCGLHCTGTQWFSIFTVRQ